MITLTPKSSVEQTVKQKKQNEFKLVGKLKPHKGHKIYEVNKKTALNEKNLKRKLVKAGLAVYIKNETK